LEKKTDDEEVDEEDEDEEEEEETRSDKGSKKGEEIETPNAEIQAPPPVIMYYCAYQGCRSVDEFECLNKIEEGAYGVVYRAKDKKTNEVVALKRLKMEKEKEGFPITSLREVDILLKMQHPNIVTVREIVVGNNMDKIYMAMEYVEHDLKSLMQHGMKKPFMTGEVRHILSLFD
jgi:cell division cycle 2-like protein